MNEYEEGYQDGYSEGFSDCMREVLQIFAEEIDSLESDIKDNKYSFITGMQKSFLAEAKSLKEQIEKELQRRNGNEIY